jgi:hypothetical protein
VTKVQGFDATAGCRHRIVATTRYVLREHLVDLVGVTLLVVMQASSALAQSLSDRVVDTEANHQRLIVNEVMCHTSSLNGVDRDRRSPAGRSEWAGTSQLVECDRLRRLWDWHGELLWAE